MSSAATNPAIKWLYHVARVIFGGWRLFTWNGQPDFSNDPGVSS